MNIVITDPPESEPLTLEDAKAHLRVTHDGDDETISQLVAAARGICEGYTGLALITRGISLYMDAWEKDIAPLPQPPLQSVSAIKVYDASGVPDIFPPTSYAVDAHSRPGRVKMTCAPPLPGQKMSGIEIAYAAGFGDAPEDIPSALKEGMKKIIAYLYLNRGDAPESALRASGALPLFQPYRVLVLA